jgi:hypothetical protein
MRSWVDQACLAQQHEDLEVEPLVVLLVATQGGFGGHSIQG